MSAAVIFSSSLTTVNVVPLVLFCERCAKACHLLYLEARGLSNKEDLGFVNLLAELS